MVKIVLIIIIVNCLIGIGLWWMIVRMIEVCMIRVRHELREYMLRRNDIKRCSRCDNDTDFIVYKGERICRVCNLITDNETGEVLSEGSDLIQSVFSDD